MVQKLTFLSKVKTVKVAIEFETADVSDVREFDVEIFSDGASFRIAKVIAVDAEYPNKLFKDVILPE